MYQNPVAIFYKQMAADVSYCTAQITLFELQQFYYEVGSIAPPSLQKFVQSLKQVTAIFLSAELIFGPVKGRIQHTNKPNIPTM